MGYFQFLKSIFWPKINLIILQIIFVVKYQARRTNFSYNFFSFIPVHEILFSKNAPYFCLLSTTVNPRIRLALEQGPRSNKTCNKAEIQ